MANGKYEKAQKVMWQSRVLIIDFQKLNKSAFPTDESVSLYIEDQMNELGQDGWEPWSIESDDDAEMALIFFKRYEIE